MKNFLSFVNIDFLAGKDSLKNWRMLFFVSVLLMFTIYSSHSVDQKTFLKTKLNKEVNTLNSISVQSQLMSIFWPLSIRKSLICYPHPLIKIKDVQ